MEVQRKNDGRGLAYSAEPRPEDADPARSYWLWVARVLVGMLMIGSLLGTIKPWHGGREVYEWIAIEGYNIRCCMLFSASLVVLAILFSRPSRR
jgi:hypothetical protein